MNSEMGQKKREENGGEFDLPILLSLIVLC